MLKSARILIVAIALALTACAGTNTTIQLDTQSPQQAVFTAKSSFLAAITVVRDYGRLPDCGTPGVLLCKSATVYARLRTLSNAADVALDEADKAVNTPGFAQDQLVTLEASASAAVRALTVITDTLTVR